MEYLVFIGAVLALLIIVKFLAWPIKKIVKLFINIALGVLLLLVANWIGNFFNFHIAINWISALVVGILGLPGVIVLVVLKLMGLF
ncbi:MAG: pro-sigmaK processing inhibitor BofA family protein [Clostridia bacterium]|nr:pro-sigmaK processing inhibitor BofA family protein [Clostridia bacterium]MDD4375679.1 pro-sigmaK processing inhibitor BofA family protein [Clostridia bacterium]